jgi:uncharacterized cupin superfamily protein
MPNLNDPLFDEPRSHPGFACRRARLGHQLATERVGLSLWDLPPGEAAYPYHFHLGEEEVLIVLEGTPHLRTPDSWSLLPEGEVVAFPIGERGAHQLQNRTGETVRFLAVSTHGMPEITVYPDEDKIGFGERLPRGGGLRAFFRAGDAVDYDLGLEPPRHEEG